MRAIMESTFDLIYLTTVILLGITMIENSKNNQYLKLFGYMALILGIGDSFHLIPRSCALLSTGLESNTYALGFGKLVTSITMTIFYLILYKIWKIRFNINNSKILDTIMYILVSLRILLCIFPHNRWFSNNSPVSWGIYRNIPFAIIGIIMIYLLYSYGVKYDDKDYKNIGIAVFLSFILYTPVVLFASKNPLIGMLMIPKTLAYVWIIFIGYKDLKKLQTN